MTSTPQPPRPVERAEEFAQKLEDGLLCLAASNFRCVVDGYGIELIEQRDAAIRAEARRQALEEAALHSREGMTLREWQRINRERNASAFGQCKDWTLNDWAVALAGEVGELLNLCKKIRRGDDIDMGDVAREIGDVAAYLPLLCDFIGRDLEDCAVGKFDEVSERIGYPVRIRALATRSAEPQETLPWADQWGTCSACGAERRRLAHCVASGCPEPYSPVLMPEPQAGAGEDGSQPCNGCCVEFDREQLTQRPFYDGKLYLCDECLAGWDQLVAASAAHQATPDARDGDQ